MLPLEKHQGTALLSRARRTPRLRMLPLVLGLPLLFSVHCRSSADDRPKGHRIVEEGTASWYGPGFHGKKTASGERYDMEELTAAHRTLPFGTVVLVTNLENRKEVRLRVNDRGPFAKKRILDVSKAGARSLGMLGPGTATVRIEVLTLADPDRGSFRVQLGAFGERANAEALVAKLGELAEGIGIYTNQGIHRVQIRGIERRSAARRLARRYRSSGIEAFVLRE